jgi:Flp pilus assembly protein protease CpaA
VYIALTLALVVCLLALAIELRKKTIPNGLTVGALLLGPALVTVLQGVVWARQPGAWTFGMEYFRAATAAVFAVWVPMHLWRRGWLGGGAVKLTAAVAAVSCDPSLGFVMGVVWVAFGVFVWWHARSSTREIPAARAAGRSTWQPAPERSYPGAALTLAAFVVAAIPVLIAMSRQ